MFELFIFVGLLGGAGFGYAALRGFRRPHNLADLQGRLQTFDTDAFLNLLNPDEEAFLRRQLPSKAYYRVRRMRIRAIIAYLTEACANARILLAYAERAMGSNNPEAAARARQLAAAAVKFQLLAMVVRSRLVLLWLFPSGDLLNGDFIKSYEQLRWGLQRIVALDSPAISSRIAAEM
ncbi:MAG TPA: hypothetical protein VKB56_09060 [Terriglobales bacterium]|nr:hypothetical protein [Terriglobales bacterium]